MMLYIGLLVFILVVVLYQVYMMTEAFAEYATDQDRIEAETAKYKPGGSNYVSMAGSSSNYSVNCITGEVTLDGKVVDNRFKKGVMQSQFKINSTIPPNGKIMDSNEIIIGDVPSACYNYTWNNGVWGASGSGSGSASDSDSGSASDSDYDSAPDSAPDSAITSAKITLSTFTLKETTTVSNISKVLNDLDTVITSLITSMKALPDIVTDITMTPAEVLAFDYRNVLDPNDSSKTLIKILEKGNSPVYLTVANAKSTFLNILNNKNYQLTQTIINLKENIADKILLSTDTVTSASNKLYSNNISWLPSMIVNLNNELAKTLLQNKFIDSFIKKNIVIDIDTDTDTDTGSGSGSTNLSNTLLAAINSLRSITNTNKARDSKKDMNIETDKDTDDKVIKDNITKSKKRIDSTPAAADPSSSPLFTKEIEDRLVKDIVTQLKDQKIADRSVNQPYEFDNEEDSGGRNCSTDVMSQGREWRKNQPDMSQYVPKDSVPCWNCSP